MMQKVASRQVTRAGEANNPVSNPPEQMGQFDRFLHDLNDEDKEWD